MSYYSDSDGEYIRKFGLGHYVQPDVADLNGPSSEPADYCTSAPFWHPRVPAWARGPAFDSCWVQWSWEKPQQQQQQQHQAFDARWRPDLPLAPRSQEGPKPQQQQKHPPPDEECMQRALALHFPIPTLTELCLPKLSARERQVLAGLVLPSGLKLSPEIERPTRRARVRSRARKALPLAEFLG